MDTYPERWDEARTDVRADLFTDTGKWKYRVELDYTETASLATQNGYVDPVLAAEYALQVAARKGTSGVTMAVIPTGWFLVVVEPPNGWPIMVKGGLS